MGKTKDITGMRFGRLVALEDTGKLSKIQSRIWRCICDCGNECEVSICELTGKSKKSCGCLKNERIEENRVDLTGQRFGRLVALEGTGKLNKQRSRIWRCICDCGNECEVSVQQLRSNTTSCGCLKRAFDDKRIKDLTGQRFGRLVALERLNKKHKGLYYWRCICDCGNECEVLSGYLINSKSNNRMISCGCFLKENLNSYLDKDTCFGTHISLISSDTIGSSNATGVKGVSFSTKGKYKGKYHPTLSFQGYPYYLGYYDTLSEATTVRHRAEQVIKDFLDWYNALSDKEKEIEAQKYKQNEKIIIEKSKQRMKQLLREIKGKKQV